MINKTTVLARQKSMKAFYLNKAKQKENALATKVEVEEPEPYFESK
jgi:hypothetical protein